MVDKRIKYCLSVLIVLLFALTGIAAASMTGTGYGASLNEAKASALSDLLSKIKVEVETSSETRLSDNGEDYSESYSRNTTVSSNLSLMFIRYDVAPSSTREDKANGKYKCIAEISDKDKALCIERAEDLVYEIESIYDALSAETDLRARRAYCDALLKRFDEYDSCLLTSRLLSYSALMPSYSSSINPEWVCVEKKKIDESLLKAGLSGSMEDTTIEGLEDKLLSKLWEGSSEKVTNTVTAKLEEGVYSKDYKVGDFGPAGGIIFYDKGEFSDGWRYLEVASSDIPGTFKYGKNGKISSRNGLGDGKNNTSDIIALNGTSSSYAALECDRYEEGGYSDWYLPSKEELEVLYKALKGDKNFNIVKDAYWSSSELNSSYAYSFSLKNKKSFTDKKTNSYRVRAVRQF